jgi:hypothetical protein
MKLFSAISAATLLSIASLSPLEASAGGRRGHINGFTVDVVESGSWSAPDFITVYGPSGPEQITVTCAPFSWSSYGANSEAFADAIATEWCF